MALRRSVPFIAALAALAVAPTALAQAPAPAKSVTAIATARVIVDQDVEKNSEAIGKAVSAARVKAGPLAVAAAREEAGRLALASRLTLGELLVVAEQSPAPFGFYGPFGDEGTFGPGKYCGTIRTRIFTRNAEGRRRATGRSRSRFGCRIPREVAQTVSVTFAAT